MLKERIPTNDRLAVADCRSSYDDTTTWLSCAHSRYTTGLMLSNDSCTMNCGQTLHSFICLHLPLPAHAYL